MKLKILIGSLIFVILLALAFDFARGAEYTNEQIVDAIWIAEGKDDATYLYGIRSIKYRSKAHARYICMNTVKFHRIRHEKHNCKSGFLSCLSRRYAPRMAENDPKGLNKNWLPNILHILGKRRK